MNNCYMHYKKNNINKLYFIILTLLIVFGFYKNGILIYKDFSNNLVMLFKPLLFPIISLIISSIFSYLKNKKIVFRENILYFLLLSMTVPVNMSLIVFTIMNIVLNMLVIYVFDKFEFKFNYIALFKILMIIGLVILNNYVYSNGLEIVNKYSYDLMDIFIGRGISGVCISSILISIIGYIVLTTNFYYKNDIPLISFFVYLTISVIFKLILGKVLIINSMIIFSLIFIAPINSFSPACKKERIIYSISLGVLTAIFTYFINMYDGVFIAIFISSLLNYIKLK